MKTQERNRYNKKTYKTIWNGVPATVRRTLFEASLFESVFASMFWHIIGIFLIWLIVFCLTFFGIMPKIFPKPISKINDIEFIIGNSTRHRGHNHKSTQKTVEAAPSNINPDKNKTNSPVQNRVRKTAKYKTNSSNSVEQAVPSFSMASLKNLKSGLESSGIGSHHSAGGGASNSSYGSLNGSSNGNSSSGTSGFDKNATRKIIVPYDISPYVSELKRNIRWNWRAPKTGGGARVELFLRIARDGRIIILNVKRTSEVGEVDNAALNAVRKCVPLNPLPAKYNKNYLDVIFTFDANSVGSRY